MANDWTQLCLQPEKSAVNLSGLQFRLLILHIMNILRPFLSLLPIPSMSNTLHLITSLIQSQPGLTLRLYRDALELSSMDKRKFPG